MNSHSTLDNPPANRTWKWEVALILLLCFLKAGWPPPDVNEAHYLAKARHYWDESWCPDDFFLDSADAHQVFYWTFGLFCHLVDLPTAAWIGRLLSWFAIAWAWQRLSFALVPRPWAAVLSAGLMIVLTTTTHMAGEWVIGGIEAKSIAYALVFWGLERLVRGHWAVVFPILGLAAAFHVLVGGWSIVAALVAWFCFEREKQTWRSAPPNLPVGFALSLFGLLPVLLLNRGVPSEIVREAEMIYVFERLPHHLVFNQFNHGFMARHLAAVIGFVALSVWLLRTHADDKLRRLVGFVGGAILLAILGIVIDQSTLYTNELAASLLRFYWFRLSDVFVPSGLALLLPLALQRLAAIRPRLTMALTVALVLATVTPLLCWNYERQLHPLPGAVLQAKQPCNDEPSWQHARDWYADWRAMCDWIRRETPPNAMFLTPPGQQTFKWHAERSEVVSVKDIPQDALGVLEWQRRRREVFTPAVRLYGFAALSEEELDNIVNKYDADYVIIETGRHPHLPNLPRVYPLGDESNETFAVYAIPLEEPAAVHLEDPPAENEVSEGQ